MKYILSLLFACCFFLTTTDAKAATYRIEATGSIHKVGSAFTPAGFVAGQSASMIWEYTSMAPSTSGGPSYASYNATTFISMTFNGQTFSSSFAG